MKRTASTTGAGFERFVSSEIQAFPVPSTLDSTSRIQGFAAICERASVPLVTPAHGETAGIGSIRTQCGP